MMSDHLNERSIELFLLDSPQVADRREEILRHVEACRQCRELFEEMKEFYQAVQVGSDPARLPEGSVLAINPQYHQAPMAIPERGTLMRWMSRHRKATAGGTVVAFAAMAWLASVWLRPDGSPSHVNFNVQQNLVEVLNARNEKLWHVPVIDASTLRSSTALDPDLSPARVVDLDGDGRNEVLIVTSSSDPRLSLRSRLAVFNAEGSVRALLGDMPAVTFRGTLYPERSAVLTMNVIRGGEGAAAEVFALITNERSPCAVIRYGPQGMVIGEYWHQGNLIGPYLYDLDGDQSPEILLIGSNDEAEDSLGASGVRAVLVVLDPRRVVGRTESSVTPGFGFSRSKAERYYIRLPRGPFDRALGLGLRLSQLRTVDSSHFVFKVQTYPGEARVMFDVQFDRFMNVQSVRPTSDTHVDIAAMQSAGILPKGQLGAKALEVYRQVEYWNGNDWTTERTSIEAGNGHQ